MKSLSTPHSQPGLLLAGSALQAGPPEAYSAPKQFACHCYGASESEIKQIVSEGNLSSVGELTELTGYGGACRACGNCLKRIVDEHLQATGQEVHSGLLAGNGAGKSPLLAQHSLT